MLATAIATALIIGLALAVSLVWARALTPRPQGKIRERAAATPTLPV